MGCGSIAGVGLPIRVALDAMGGDSAPASAVAGAIQAARAWGYHVQLVGQPVAIHAELERRDARGLEALLQVVDAPEVVAMHEHPAAAVRGKRQSSLAVGLTLVRSGEADAFVSAGNTGAVLATALMTLRRIDGLASERPALAAIVPTLADPSVVLDVGANVDCRPEWLAQFAMMGSIYAEAALGRANPSVATLSIGEEEDKGNALLAEAVPLIRKQPIRYLGHVEGKDVTVGVADVVVTDGFSGNVFLKTAEGVAATVIELLRRELSATATRKLLAAGLRPAFRAVRRRMSYEEYGGVPLLGVGGVCIVAHGRSTDYAIANAIRAGARCAELGLVDRIADGIRGARAQQ